MRLYQNLKFNLFTIVALLCSSLYANVANTQALEGVSCVVSVGNRNAPLSPDGSYFITAIPGNLGAVRARATCSDGSVGQSAVGFTDVTQTITIPLGPIRFGTLDPVPVAVSLTAPQARISTGESSQLALTAVAVDGSTRDVTSRSEGTVYSISNSLLATVTEQGLVTITGQFDTASTARLVASATTEGSVSSTFMYVLGPRGSIVGKVFHADGSTPVAAAQIAVLRLQPMEVTAITTSDGNGDFQIDDVNAGNFLISVLDPATGSRALTGASIQSEGEVAQVSINLNGIGQVNVTVVNDINEPVAASEVTLTALGSFVDVRTAATDASGLVSFENVTAGDFTVSTRDPATGLLGAVVSQLGVGESQDITVKLQETGGINGTVFDVDGSTVLAGIQVRLQSRQRGVISQTISDAMGYFSFNTLPKEDGAFMLDAFTGGRLRARVPGIVFSQGEETLQRDIVLSAVGMVTGTVKSAANQPLAQIKVSMQSLVGLRLSFDAVTNANGEFVLPAVPIGDFELTASTNNGQTTRANGTINADGDNVNIDMVVADNTIVGTVFQRDGTTPVAAGVMVYLASRSLGKFYSYNGVTNVSAVQTDAQGNYGFPISQAGDYYVQAEQGLDRGRSRAVLVNLDPSQPLQTNVTFLAKGSVTGVVTNANGVIQIGVSVKVYTQGAFDASRTITTNNVGRYQLDGVFAGDLVVSALDPITAQSGVRQARLDAEGQQVTVDVVLSASGSIHGQILKSTGTISAEVVNIRVLSNGIEYTNFNVVDGQSYQVLQVPIGNVKVIAKEIVTGDLGIATTRIDSLNEDKQIDVHLIGQGQLNVQLVDASNNPVIAAKVTATTQSPFRTTQERFSDSNGMLTFNRILAGDFSVSAIKDTTFGSMQGNYSGTMLANDTQQVTVQMDAVAVGSISGVVYQSDGITPQGAGWTVRMLPEPYQDAFVTFTNANGEYSFPQVNAGTYNIDVYSFYDLRRIQCPIRGRIRARASAINLSVQDEQVIANLQFIGAGEVFGVVRDEQGQGDAGITLTLTNSDPVFGLNSTCGGRTTYITTTNAAGEYSLTDIPAGNFSIIAENSDKTSRAEATGRIQFDTDTREVDLTLINNVVTMPYSFYDANGFLSDVTGDGSIASGTRNIFAAAAPDTAAMKLEIINNGVTVPFLNGNGTLGKLLADGQEIVVDDTTPSGLFVSRRIYTPRSGYFSRYLEILENPTQQAITVNVKITSHHRTSQSNPRVVDSSDGDQVLSVANQALPDRWVVIDDQTDADPFANNSIPATGHLFDGTTARTQVATAQYALIGQTGKLTYQWNNLNIEPNQRIILMHFVMGQIQRTGARQAALRLEQMPPEAIDDLTTDEREDIYNFQIPTTSPLAALPNLTAGQLSGQVLSGNGVNTVPNAKVTFVSQHPLFARIRTVNSDAQGLYDFHSTLDGSINNYVIPVFDFNISASYPLTAAVSAITPGSFAVDTTQTTQDVIFIGQGDVTGSVLRHNGATVADANIVMCKVDDRNACIFRPDNRAISQQDGSYTLYANTPRDYFLYVDKAHPQNYSRNIQGQATVTATAADVTVANIIMEETGSIAGIIKAADGTPVSEAVVLLYDLNTATPTRIRKTISDTAGFYRFFDVPLGQFEMRVTDIISHATGQATAEVFVDQETNQDINLLSTATLNVMVQYDRGVFANNARVELVGGGISLNARTDSNGLAQFQLPTGVFNLTAYHPDRGIPLITHANVEILASDNNVDLTIKLPAAGEVTGTIIRPDGTTLAGGFPYSITQIRGTSIGRINKTSDGVGAYREVGLPLGDYIITAFDAEQDRFADAEFSVISDGQEILLDLTLLDERIALPADLYDVNRFIFDIQQDGSIKTGTRAFSTGASVLSIDNQIFTGDTSARLQAGKRQFAITQASLISGLQVTRKIYVPKGAYFARYIEVLDNPSNTDISVDVKLEHGFAEGQYFQTSSQDISLTTQDNWFMVDDDLDEDVKLHSTQMPATAHLFTDASATLAPTNINISYTNLMAHVQQQWTSITIPAGQRVSLIHVFVQQINRAGAEFALDRLNQLPPELLADLTSSDLQTVINFSLPSDGVSSLASLPPLTASISGQVFEGSDSNPIPVPNTRVTVQSTHPLFSRVWGKLTDPVGCPGPGTVINSLYSAANDASYSLQGQLTDVDSIAIPAGIDVKVVAQQAQPCYFGASGHPFTQTPSREVTLEAPATQDVIFDTTVVTGTVIGTANFAVTVGKLYRSIDNIEFPDYQYVTIANDGSFAYPGLPSGQYDFLFDTTHPDRLNNDVLRGSRLAANVPFRQVFVSDVSLQATGSIQGTVLSFDSTPSVNAEITLTGLENDQNYDQCAQGCDVNTLAIHKGKYGVNRRVITDSQGLYNFSAIPDGLYAMQVIDPVSGGISNLNLSIVANQVTVQNVVLTAVGSATVTVNDALNNPKIDSIVYLNAEAEGFEKVVGRTNVAGQLVIANIPLGNYTIRVSDPRAPAIRYMDRTIADNISSAGQANTHQLNLRAAADIVLMVIDSDQGGAAVVNANIHITDARGSRNLASTDASGQSLIATVPEGSYTITASFNAGQLKEKSITGQINTSDNNTQIAITIDLRSQIVTLPSTIRDANSHAYTVSANQGNQNLPQLLINNELFIGETTAVSRLQDRQFEIDGINSMSGLQVTRKLYVPINGYFIRYIEQLSNPTATDINVELEIDTTISSKIILNSSNGDNILDNTAPVDHWFTSAINANSSSAHAFISSGENAALTPPISTFTYVNNSTRTAAVNWSNIIIPANSQVQILHFYAPQSSSESATASAQRLVQLPPETLTGLQATDVNEIINFAVPPNLISSLELLPELNGSISGTVYEGDGITPVIDNNVTIKSNHLLFNNTYSNDYDDYPTLKTDTLGYFSLTGDLTSGQFPIAIPVDGSFTLSAFHPVSTISATANASFAIGATQLNQDIVYTTGSIAGLVSGAYQPNPDFINQIYVILNNNTVTQQQANSDGSFIITGLNAGNYRLETRTGDFSGRLIGVVDPVQVNIGEVTTQNLVYAANGGVTGQVFSNTGIEQPNQTLELRQDSSSFVRTITTDATGSYKFGAIPTGVYQLTAFNSTTQAGVTYTIIISANQLTQQDFTLAGTGSVTITVHYTAGAAATNLAIYLQSPTVNGSVYLGTTDTNGELIAEISVGAYTLVTSHPLTSQEVQVLGNVNAANEISSIELILPVSANLQWQVMDADQNNAPIVAAKISVSDINDIQNLYTGRTTDATGMATLNNLIQSSYLIKVEVNNQYESSFIMDITDNDDGLTLSKQVIFAESQHIIAAFEFDQAHHLYQVAMTAGEVLSLSLRHFVSSTGPGSFCSINVNVYNPNGVLIAQGGGGHSRQFNYLARIDQINATTTGQYSLELSPASNTCFSGFYRLATSINAQPKSIEYYQQGGTVSGTLFEADGTTGVAGHLVRLANTSQGPVYDKQIQTDVNGNYVFTNIPLGDFELTYVLRPSVMQTGTLTTAGESIALNLILPQTTIFEIHVLNADGTPLNRQAQLDIRETGKTTLTVNTDLQGIYTHTYFGFNELGIAVKSLSNPQIIANQFVQPADGQTIVVNLTLSPATIQGVIYKADGVTSVANALISAYYVNNDELIKNQYSNAQGQYVFDKLPIDNDIILKATDPINENQTITGSLTTSILALTQDILLQGTGTIFGRLTGVGGAPKSNANIMAEYLTDLSDVNSLNTQYATTNNNGEYTINDLPLGRVITVSYQENTDFGNVNVSGQASLIGVGDAQEVNLLIPGSSLTFQLQAADGLPSGVECDFRLNIQGIGSTGLYGLSCDSLASFVGLPESFDGNGSQVTIEVLEFGFESLFLGSYLLPDSQLLEVSEVLSVLQGTVTYYDMTLAPSAQIISQDKQTNSDENGQYRMIGLDLGVHSITVEDDLSSLQTTSEATLTDVTVPVNLDIQFPAAGTINGQVLDIDGSTMAGIDVHAASSNSPAVNQSTSDSNGYYEISNIVVGEIELSAVNQTSKNIASQQATLMTDKEIQTHDIQFQAPGSITGTVYDDTAMAAANACVQMQYTRIGTVHQSLNFTNNSDANGIYNIASAAAGDVLLMVKDDCENSTQNGIQQSQIISNSSTNQDISMGNGQALKHTLNQAAVNFGFRIGFNNSIQPIYYNGTSPIGNQPFSQALTLKVNGNTLNSQPVVTSEMSGQQLLIGPDTTKNLSFTHKVYATPSGNYLRILDSITNTSVADVEVKVSFQGRYGVAGIGTNNEINVVLVADPQINNNRYAIHKYISSVPGLPPPPTFSLLFSTPHLDTNPAVTGYVFASSNNTLPVVTDFKDAHSHFSWSWTQTLAPGQSVSFLSYVVVNKPELGDVANVTTIINQLINQTEVDMFNGMSAEERANTLNFEVPQ